MLARNDDASASTTHKEKTNLKKKRVSKGKTNTKEKISFITDKRQSNSERKKHQQLHK